MIFDKGQGVTLQTTVKNSKKSLSDNIEFSHETSVSLQKSVVSGT